MSRSRPRPPFIVYPGLALAVVGLVVLLAPPFLLPEPIYGWVHGWRYPLGWECGDVLVTDRGPRAAERRYSADVGELSGEPLHLCRLPKEALRPTVLVPRELATEGREVSLRIVRSARTEGAEPIEVFRETGTLGQEWSEAASPVRGWRAFEAAEVFRATPKADYELLVESSSPARSRIVLHGGGWRRW